MQDRHHPLQPRRDGLGDFECDLAGGGGLLLGVQGEDDSVSATSGRRPGIDEEALLCPLFVEQGQKEIAIPRAEAEVAIMQWLNRLG